VSRRGRGRAHPAPLDVPRVDKGGKRDGEHVGARARDGGGCVKLVPQELVRREAERDAVQRDVGDHLDALEDERDVRGGRERGRERERKRVRPRRRVPNDAADGRGRRRVAAKVRLDERVGHDAVCLEVGDEVAGDGRAQRRAAAVGERPRICRRRVERLQVVADDGARARGRRRARSERARKQRGAAH
jgi:hypothetical protein